MSHSEDLPRGWTTSADAGIFRLARRPEQAYFGFNLGQESWKKYLFPSRLPLFQAQRRQGGVSFQPIADTAPPFALIGVRACELAALEVQDRTLRDGPYADPVYTSRRQNLFIVAVNCTESDAACFCASLGTGPGVKTGFDLALTELVEAAVTYFSLRPAALKVKRYWPNCPNSR